MEFTLETKTRVLVLDERVYKGKSRLYVVASEDLGIIKVVGKGLYMFGTFEVYIKKSRTLYYLEEAKPLYDYRHMLRNPKVVETYSIIFSIINGYDFPNTNVYKPLVNVLEKLDKEPSTTHEKVRNVVRSLPDDPERVIEGFLMV